mmetsp:Transcript_21709/g.32220  ORF Transcript_21709/g.32220 Transcript_21709/m.32220 type:complete len:1460 (+) Transcript_21709:30-4409(+)
MNQEMAHLSSDHKQPLLRTTKFDSSSDDATPPFKSSSSSSSSSSDYADFLDNRKNVRFADDPLPVQAPSGSSSESDTDNRPSGSTQPVVEPKIKVYSKTGENVEATRKTLREAFIENRETYFKSVPTNVPATVVVDRVSFTVPTDDGREKKILNNLSFVLKPKQMVLLLGMPGCGKSTLFKLLANQLPKYGTRSGAYFYNGHAPDSRKFHRLVSYVTQEDVHMPAYTVRQTFTFSARCQMPEGTPDYKIEERVEAVINLLGLSKAADTLIGDNLLRGISGGEKKRVTIGIEFMKGPGLYLLDEPTTGLDAKTAIDIFQSVRVIADLGPPVVVVLKQPSYELFQLFDTVMIMTEGTLAFMGPTSEGLPYFETLGYKCPRAMNPVDFLAEVVEQPEDYLMSVDESSTASSSSSRRTAERVANAPRTPDQFVEAYEKSKFGEAQRRAVINEIPQVITRVQPAPRDLPRDHPEYFRQYPQPLWYQCWLCTVRAFEFVAHTPKSMMFRIIKSVLMALFIGTMFFDLTAQWDDDDAGQKAGFSLQGLMFNVIAFIGFAALASMPQTIAERRIFYYQRAARYYSTFPYFLAGILVELPIALAESIVYGSIVYWMAGLNASADRFIFFLLVNIALSLAMNAYCRFCACASRNFAVANASAPGGIALMILFAGYIIQEASIPPWFIWIYWLSPFHYAYEAMTINQLVGERFKCKSDELLPPLTPANNVTYNGQQVCAFRTGEQLLVNRYGFPSDFNSRWTSLAVLVGFFFVFQVAAYFALRFIRFKPVINEKEDKKMKKRNSGIPDPHAMTNAGLLGHHVGGTGAHHGSSSSSTDDDDYRGMSINPSGNASGYMPVLNSTSSAHQQDKPVGAYLSFLNLCYTVPTPDGDRDLLKNVTGFVKPGMLLALMGPSGAGKTTLLDVIAAKKTGGTIGGELLFNGRPRNEFFHRFTGYVEQQDMHKMTTTVREALIFSARTRLAVDDEHQQEAQAEQVLRMLELDDIADQMVAGLAAEELKRLTIGVELVAQPTLLFLDEPTSGLDAIGALNVMRSIQKAASTGRTIICTIHQPSAKIFSFFSHLLLMKRGGEVIYFGETGRDAQVVLDYFASLGLNCSPHRNPADFVLEAAMATVNDQNEPVDLVQEWQEAPMSVQTVEEIQQGVTPDDYVHENYTSRYARGFWDQLKLTFARQVGGYRRTPVFVLMKIIRQVIVGLLLGFLFFQLSDDLLGAQEVVGLIFFAVLFANLGALAAIPFFFEDRAVYYRERDSGCYYSITYLLSIIIVELPLILMSALAFTVSMYFLVGLNLTNGGLPIVFFYFTYLGAMLASLGLAQLCAVVSPTAQIANAIAALIVSLFSLSAGFLLTRTLIPDYWIWLYYLSFVTYSLEALTINQVEGANYHCEDDQLLWVPVSEFEVKPYCPIQGGDTILGYFDMSADNRWRDFGIIFAYWFAFIIATWACLQYVKLIKR